MIATILTGAALGLFISAGAIAAADPHDDRLAAALMLCAAIAAFVGMVTRRV